MFAEFVKSKDDAVPWKCISCRTVSKNNTLNMSPWIKILYDSISKISDKFEYMKTRLNGQLEVRKRDTDD